MGIYIFVEEMMKQFLVKRSYRDGYGDPAGLSPKNGIRSDKPRVELYYLTADNMEQARNHPLVKGWIENCKRDREDLKNDINVFDRWERFEFHELPLEVNTTESAEAWISFSTDEEVSFGFWEMATC